MGRVALLCMLAVVATTRPSFAYIDPGITTIALQAAIGAIAVGWLFFRNAIAKAFRLLRAITFGGDNKTSRPSPKTAVNGDD